MARGKMQLNVCGRESRFNMISLFGLIYPAWDRVDDATLWGELPTTGIYELGEHRSRRQRNAARRMAIAGFAANLDDHCVFFAAPLADACGSLIGDNSETVLQCWR